MLTITQFIDRMHDANPQLEDIHLHFLRGLFSGACVILGRTELPEGLCHTLAESFVRLNDHLILMASLEERK